MTKDKLGIIGAGYWATNIIKTLEDMNIKNIYVYDRDQSKLKLIKEKFNHAKIIFKEDDFYQKVNNAIIVTPPKTHYRIAKKCINKNLNVFLEKPATLKKKHLKELGDLTKIKNKKLIIGYIYNFNVYIEYIRKVLLKKTLGDIKYISIERSNLGPIRNDNSCFWDLGSHDLSTLIYLTGKIPKIKKAIGYSFLKKKIFDVGNVFLSIGSTQVEIKSSWLNPEKIRKTTIVGSKKMLLFDEMNLKQPIKVYNQYAKYPDIKNFKKSFFSATANIYYGRVFSPKIKFISPLRKEMSYFLKIINSKLKFFKNDVDHGLKVHSLLETIDKKLKNSI